MQHRPDRESGPGEGRWIGRELWGALVEENTTAHRIVSGPGWWGDRFGEALLWSFRDEQAWRRGLAEWEAFVERAMWRPAAIYGRQLTSRNEARNSPVLLEGAGRESWVATERGARFKVAFDAGYSVGLFCDQRENRRHLEDVVRPERLLNTFCYTCAFSVVAARAGGKTLNVDVAKKALRWGQENFALNGMSAEGHRFIADDVFGVLPRLIRRRERFDGIVVDPPTFSRGAGGKVFRVREQMGDLVELALELLEVGGWVLISTNCEEMESEDVEGMVMKVGGARVESHAVAGPPDYEGGDISRWAWARRIG